MQRTGHDEGTAVLDWMFPNAHRKLDTIMANLDGLNAAVDQVQTDVGEAVAELRRLGDLIRNGDGITQEDIDAVTAKVAGLGTTLDDAVAEDETPPA